MLLLWAAFLSLSVTVLGHKHACCAFPCQNGGTCLDDDSNEKGFICDCTHTGYSGETCDSRGFNIAGRLADCVTPSVPTLVWVTRRFNFLWNLINAIKPLWRFVVGVVLQGQIDAIDTIAPGGFFKHYRYIDAAFNMTIYSPTLAPVPEDCPTATGKYGPAVGKQPDPNDIFDVIFKRKKFTASKIRSNVFFSYFAQHFTHQLFQSDHSKPGFIWSPTHQIDMNQVYGHTSDIQAALRSFKDGKFKLQKINGEEWPMYAKDIKGWKESFGLKTEAMILAAKQPFSTEEDYFALAHPLYAPNPGLVALSVMWMREHNRICDILRKAHSTWDDERLFQTARLVVIAVNARVVLTDYVQHLSGFNIALDYSPELIRAPYGTNRVRMEYNYLYHWHALVPETWDINGTDLPHKEFFGHSSMLPKLGLGRFISDASNQPAGEVSRHNFAEDFRPVITAPIREARALRIQSLNNHRRKFKLTPHASFLDLTGGDKELAQILEKWYGHVEAVELIPGFYAEPTLEKGLTPETVTILGAAYAVFGLFTLPIAAPNWWKPSTFGGKAGWDIFQETITLQQIVCRNIPGPCPTNIGMKFPAGNEKKYEL